jgi:predicted transcriptional regulator
MTATAKERIRQVLDEVPDDASYEDIEYRIYLRRKIDQGLEDIRQGRVLSHEEVERRMAKWLGE